MFQLSTLPRIGSNSFRCLYRRSWCSRGVRNNVSSKPIGPSCCKQGFALKLLLIPLIGGLNVSKREECKDRSREKYQEYTGLLWNNLLFSQPSCSIFQTSSALNWTPSIIFLSEILALSAPYNSGPAGAEELGCGRVLPHWHCRSII